MWKQNNTETIQLINVLTEKMNSCGRLPKNCDLSALGPLHMASLFDDLEKSKIISESVFCGMDTDPDVSIVKALVECVERNAFLEGSVRNDPACSTLRSDGLAAFPVKFVGAHNAKSVARKHALAEAIERFSWATWWDDHEISAQVNLCGSYSLSTGTRRLLSEISKLVDVQEYYLVSPRIDDPTKSVQIFYAVLSNDGIICGGACDDFSNLQSIHFRALGELARHAVCAKLFIDGASPTTHYEEKLHHLATQRVASAFRSRIKLRSESILKLPSLAIDTEIDHLLSDIVKVHRCYFQGQPPFVEGPLERLCI